MIYVERKVGNNGAVIRYVYIVLFHHFVNHNARLIKTSVDCHEIVGL